jgi:hypothetical protein
MTLSERKSALILGLLLSLAAFGTATAATPPDAELNAAGMAIAAAVRAQPRGPAADALAEAQSRYGQAQDAMARRKYKDALRLADEARAGADRALAAARLDAARADVDAKTTRNVDLRRQLLVVPETPR